MRINRIAGSLTILLCAWMAEPAVATPLYRVVDIGALPGDMLSSPQAISNSGQIVGISESTSYSDRPFLYTYSNGTMIAVPTPGATGGIATGINANGQAVGIMYMDSGAQDSFLYSAGTTTDLTGLTSGPSTMEKESTPAVKLLE